MAAALIQTVFDALLLIGLYAIGALGFSLLWGVLNVLNLAYAALIAAGGYATYQLWLWGLDPLAAIPVSMAFMFVLGWLLQRFTIDFVLSGPHSLSITLTYGVNLIVTALLFWLFTAEYKSIRLPSYLVGSIEIAGAQLTYARLVTVVIALGLTAAIWWFMDRTELGTAIRATRLDTEAAKLVGIRVRRIYRLTAGISAMLAGAMGSIAVIVYSASPQMGETFLVQIFIVTVLGGLGSVVGPLVGSVVVGLVNSVVGNYWGATYSTAVGSLLVLAVLFVRPSGLLGRRFYEE